MVKSMNLRESILEDCRVIDNVGRKNADIILSRDVFVGFRLDAAM